MKKMKTKRLFAVLLTLAMVLGMTVMAFATVVEPPAEKQPNTDEVLTQKVEGVPTAANKAPVEVKNVEAGETVTAYRIVEAAYGANGEGFTGYKAASGVAIANVLEPTSSEVTSLAALIANGSLVLEQVTLEESEADPTTYTGRLGAGYWLVLVTNDENEDVTKIYNPMLLGVYYTADDNGKIDTVTGGAVDANSDWSLNSTPAYAKSQKPAFDKKITGSTVTDNPLNPSGNDVAIGDTVNFEITAQIPSYSEAYKNVMVKISDTVSGSGLEIDTDSIKVKVGTASGTAVEVSGAAVYALAPVDQNGFTITFTSEYALAHAGEYVYVTYDAVLGENANLNFDPNTNKATFEYTNDPSGDTTTEKDETRTYTFAIDSNLYGKEESEWNKVTVELLKTGEVHTETVSGTAVTTTALSGAVFELKSVDRTPETEIVRTATSDALGHLSFTGLDAGKYELREVKAPEGYSLNEAVIPVEITATYNEDGTLNEYVIKVNGKNTSTYVATYEKDKTISNITATPGHTGNANENEIAKNDVSDTFEIKNTTLTELPSTGGIGTTIFTIAGCLIMILAAALFFASRRKTSKK